MLTFKNTLDIISNPWNYNFSSKNVSPPFLPTSTQWAENREITVNDVILWEQLYYEPGNIGVYAAYNPYAEFYLITFNLFLNSDARFEEFVGDDAAQKCYDRAVELGIYLQSF
jgi:hypothetical protein